MWELPEESNKKSLTAAIDALHAHQDPGSKMLTAQDLQYAKQCKGETVDSFVKWLEKTYQKAYGHDGLVQQM